MGGTGHEEEEVIPLICHTSVYRMPHACEHANSLHEERGENGSKCPFLILEKNNSNTIVLCFLWETGISSRLSQL